jgi:hypothetical protein
LGGVSPPPWSSIFSDYSFLLHHLVNWDDRHLLAHAEDFTVAKTKICCTVFVTLKTASCYVLGFGVFTFIQGFEKEQMKMNVRNGWLK